MYLYGTSEWNLYLEWESRPFSFHLVVSWRGKVIFLFIKDEITDNGHKPTVRLVCDRKEYEFGSSIYEQWDGGTGEPPVLHSGPYTLNFQVIMNSLILTESSDLGNDKVRTPADYPFRIISR